MYVVEHFSCIQNYLYIIEYEILHANSVQNELWNVQQYVFQSYCFPHIQGLQLKEITVSLLWRLKKKYIYCIQLAATQNVQKNAIKKLSVSINGYQEIFFINSDSVKIAEKPQKISDIPSLAHMCSILEQNKKKLMAKTPQTAISDTI